MLFRSAAIADLGASGLWHSPVVTEVVEAPEWYPAEDYHQGYYRTNPYSGYCQVVIEPKVAKARAKYLERLKA